MKTRNYLVTDENGFIVARFGKRKLATRYIINHPNHEIESTIPREPRTRFQKLIQEMREQHA